MNNIPASLGLTWRMRRARDPRIPLPRRLRDLGGRERPGDILTTNSTSVTINFPVLSIAPATASVAPQGTQAFTASGGSGAGYTGSVTSPSGGSISASGVYTQAPPAASPTWSG